MQARPGKTNRRVKRKHSDIAEQEDRCTVNIGASEAQTASAGAKDEAVGGDKNQSRAVVDNDACNSQARTVNTSMGEGGKSMVHDRELEWRIEMWQLSQDR